MEAVFEDHRGANGSAAQSLGQLLISEIPRESQGIPSESEGVEDGDDEDLPVPKHVRVGQKRSSNEKGLDPKKKKKMSHYAAVAEGFERLAEAIKQRPTDEYFHRAMDIFNSDWADVLPRRIAEAAQIAWEESDRAAMRFVLARKEDRGRYFRRFG
jgi:hypothetical protein